MAASTAPLVLFAPAFGQAIGGGHLLRCLALATAVSERGGRVLFAVPEAAVAPLARFSPAVESRTISPGDLPRLCAELTPGALVLDDYGAGAPEEVELRGHVRRLMVIDDLADRPHIADLLLDTGYGRKPADYAALLPPPAALLLGPEHALLRPAFAAARARICEVAGVPERIFLSFGLTDVGGITARGVEAVRTAFPQARLDIVLSSSAASLRELRRRAELDPGLALHVDATDVAALMAVADLAVGAGGTSTWERCCLGLPSIVLPVADNQLPTVLALQAEGVHLMVDPSTSEWPVSLAAAAERLKPPDTRRRLRVRSMRICDGLGAGRVAETLLAGLA
jgi:UDP-2,4-diacetamido-2,4,6-trideoxy-beta-L-altropyranose hydrolase